MKLELDPQIFHETLETDNRFVIAINDMKAPMSRAVDVIVQSIEENFDTESQCGDPWAPLKDSTIARRQKDYGSGPILERTGDMRRAATGYRSSDAESAEVGNDGNGYAVHHHYRTVNMPMRRSIDLSPQGEDEIMDLIWAHLEAAGG